MVKDLCFEIIETCLNNCMFCSSNSNCNKTQIIKFEDFKRTIDYFMANGGIEACAQIVYDIFGSNAESAKDLAYRLYTIAERKGWAEEGYAYNALVVAWSDIQSRAAAMKAETPEQLNLFE